MDTLTRRAFVKSLAAIGASLTLPRTTAAKGGGRVVIIGGGFGGATCAHDLRRYDPGIDVTLIEQNPKYVTCPFSNTVLGGINRMDFITHSYDKLRAARGCNLIHDTAVGIDAVGRKVTLKGGRSIPYDHLVLAPGISFRRGEIEGHDENASQIMPHAWQAGAQTVLLRERLVAMKDGGTVLIALPSGPFRAPPAPYERASLIAHYLRQYKPRSKIVILDSGTPPSKLALFQGAWQTLYPGMIEWVQGGNDGRIARIDTRAMTLHTRAGTTYRGDVVNLIPAQQAGSIARMADLTDADGWCRVDPVSFESTRQKGIHVIGDACAAGDMPKTGHAASIQGKVCAAAIVARLRGAAMPEPIFESVTYSLVGPKYAISAAGVFRLQEGKIKSVASALSPETASKKTRLQEAEYAYGWYRAITSEMFAT